MTDTPLDAAMTLSKQELARQLVEANAEIERLRKALEEINSPKAIVRPPSVI
jgi:hypothetical protein